MFAILQQNIKITYAQNQYLATVFTLFNPLICSQLARSHSYQSWTQILDYLGTKTKFGTSQTLRIHTSLFVPHYHTKEEQI